MSLDESTHCDETPDDGSTSMIQFPDLHPPLQIDRVTFGRKVRKAVRVPPSYEPHFGAPTVILDLWVPSESQRERDIQPEIKGNAISALLAGLKGQLARFAEKLS